MTRKIGITTLMIMFALTALLGAYPYKESLGLPNIPWLWSDSEGKARPAHGNASGSAYVYAELATDSISLVLTIASITAELVEFMAQQSAEAASDTLSFTAIETAIDDNTAANATNTDDVILAVQTAASDTHVDLSTDSIGIVTAVYGVATEVSDLAAAIASHVANILAYQASGTQATIDFAAQNATDSEDLLAKLVEILTANYTVATNVTSLAAQLATETDDTIAAISTLTAGLATPTITNVDSTVAAATLSNIASRYYIIIQNKHATESAYIGNSTITPGEGIELMAGSTITRQWNSDVAVVYVSTNTVPLTIDEEVRP